MNIRKTVSVLLAMSVAVTCLAGASGCKKNKREEETGIRGETAYGNKTLTDAVKNPSDEAVIKLIRGRNVIKESAGSLTYDKALQAGDIIEIESDYKYVNVKLFDSLGEQLIYSPTGRITFQIPSSGAQAVYGKDAFGGTSHAFSASKASGSEVSERRNLALNPYDFMYVDEKNDQNKSDNAMDVTLVDSQALSQVSAFPHAYANRVTRNEAGFYARNAIDGCKDATDHGNYPYQSWGYDKKKDAEFTVYFGREVTIDKAGFVLRADYSLSGGKEHDTYWESVTLEFSDGTTQKIEGFEKSGDLQEFDITEVSTTYVRIKDIKEVENADSEMFAALTEFEVYGTENISENAVAEKTVITSGFGGKEQDKFKTSDFGYSEIKDVMDKSNDWFIDKTENEKYQIPNHDGKPMDVKIDDSQWKDAVYYSGLTEAFFTTGDMNKYYFLRGIGNQFKYLNDNGNHTPHGDNYQIGETYLQLNDIRGASFKVADTVDNAIYNLNRDMNDKTPPKVSGSEWIDPNRDWSHMGWWWCDALYMALNTYTLLSLQTGDKKYVEQAFEGYTYWKEELYNGTYNLWWRDSSQKGLKTNSVDADTNEKFPVFWSRGNAWVLAALAKQLLYLDENEFPEIYAAYRNDYSELAESIAKYQRGDGTWNASIVDETYYGGKESTGTMGYIYAYCVGLRLGVLDSDVYYPVVKKAWNGIVENCIFESGQVGYMQTTGYQPQNYKDEATSKNNTHEFGMGLFLLACSGMMSICEDYEIPSVIVPADPQATLIG